MKNPIWLVMLTALLPLSAYAGPAGPLSVTESVEINAPADDVWQSVNDFGDLGAWHPAVASTEITEGENNQPGARRLLTLQDGGTIDESLEAYDDEGMSFTYVINEGVLPVSDYRSTITVTSTGDDTSTVTWRGDFKRKSMDENPPEGEDDKTATDTMTAVYRAGLDNLKQQMEQ